VNGGGFCCDDSPRLKAGAIGNGNDNPETFQYYYHNDHLGSTSLITDLDGNVVQHVEYVPFGEVFIEERNNKWNTPYLFNAKELDEETGLYYYGARHYDGRVSLWLGVDPMWEKYPNFSTYAYCVQNPVKFIDPTGMEGEEGGAQGTYVIIYGAGYDNPIAKSHNQGDNFKKNSEAQKQNLIKQGIPESSIVSSSAFTEQEFLDVVNKEYDSGKIVQLDVYSHMSNNAINFGGYETMETATASPPDKDYRLLSYWSNGGVNGYNPDGDNEILKINNSNFSSEAKVNLWGCNAGWFNDTTPKEYAFAQGLANHLNATVGAFDSYSEFKQKNGNLLFDGTMIRTKDRATQKVKQSVFTPTSSK
jgi:RHS repeat-associated protein